MRLSRFAVPLAFITGLTLQAATIPLSSIQTIYAFGDSLSDDGNAYILTGGTQPSGNYAPGLFTDGPNTTPATHGPQGLWIQQLAGRLGVPVPTPVLNVANPGTNYAIGSAQSGTANPQDLGNQIALFSSTHLTGAPSNALYSIWAGSDDILNGHSGTTAADNVMNDILFLSSEGAKYFLWPNVAPLGNTPYGVATGQTTAFNQQSTAFDNEWAKDLAILQGSGIDVVGVDINSLFAKVAADNASGCTVAASDPYCFANITTPAQGLSGVNPDTYLFWDSMHPTTEGHALIATAAYNALAGVPEPMDAGLAAIGMLTILAVRRLKSRKDA